MAKTCAVCLIFSPLQALRRVMRNRLEINLLLPLQPSPLMRDWNFYPPHTHFHINWFRARGLPGLQGKGGRRRELPAAELGDGPAKFPFLYSSQTITEILVTRTIVVFPGKGERHTSYISPGFYSSTQCSSLKPTPASKTLKTQRVQEIRGPGRQRM